MRSLLCLFSLIALPALAVGLNDTGVTTCFDGSTLLACATANSSDSALYPSQDARYGRDAAQAASKLPSKIGGGVAGFDFTPLDASGNTIPLTGTPPVPAAMPVCTRDNVTGLIWEVKTTANRDTTLTWQNAAIAASTTNSAGLCGALSGWRVPSRRELLSIVHRGRSNPSIDTNYFPNTASEWYWSSDVYTPVTGSVWVVSFDGGHADTYLQSNGNRVRLVRSGQ